MFMISVDKKNVNGDAPATVVNYVVGLESCKSTKILRKFTWRCIGRRAEPSLVFHFVVRSSSILRRWVTRRTGLMKLSFRGRLAVDNETYWPLSSKFNERFKAGSIVSVNVPGHMETLDWTCQKGNFQGSVESACLLACNEGSVAERATLSGRGKRLISCRTNRRNETQKTAIKNSPFMF